MHCTYAEKKREQQTAPNKASSTVQGPSLDALRSGAAKPTAEQMGRRVDLPDAMRGKMESAFGADLSAVKLYESEAVADAGASAITQGSNIAFAPGMLDFASYGGRALLGHEISHVVSQARGDVTGSGFLNDHALETRADREGAMAAAGQQIAMPAAAVSSVTAASAAGPMQASKFGGKKKEADPYAPLQKIRTDKVGKVNRGIAFHDLVQDTGTHSSKKKNERTGLAEELLSRYTGEDSEYLPGTFGNVKNGDFEISGLGLDRMVNSMEGSFGEGYSRKEIIAMYDDLMAPHRRDLNRDDADAVAAANERFTSGVSKLKEMQFRKLKRLEATYGTLPSQMHPEDFVRLAGDQYNDHFRQTQDTQAMLDSAGGYFDFEHNPQDREFKALHEYYYTTARRNTAYALQDQVSDVHQTPMDTGLVEMVLAGDPYTPEMESQVHGPSLSPEEQQKYMAGLKKRAAKEKWTDRLFGKFR